ncbi:hypothetical protein D3C73_600780 [compost metagenome]
MLVGVLDHHDRRIDHRPDGNRNATEAHDVGADIEEMHGNEGHQHAHRQHDDGDERTANMQEKDDRDERDDDRLLHKSAFQGFDRGLDQLRAIIGRHDFGTSRQAVLDGLKACLGIIDDRQCIGTEPLKHDAACDFAFTVEFGDPPPFVGNQFDPCNITEPERRAAHRLQNDVLDIGYALQIAAPAHHELEFGKLDRAAPDIRIAGAHGIGDVGERNVLRLQPDRIDHDGILPDETADTGDLGNTFGFRYREPHDPVLQGPQLRKRHLLCHHGILIDPADTRRIRTERRRDPARKAALRDIEIFKHAAARPVRIGAILEDHIDEGCAEEGEAPHHLGFRHCQHGGRQRIGHLVLDDLRRLTGIIGVDDHLNIGEIGNGVERQRPQGVNAARDRQHGSNKDQDQIAGGPGYHTGDHCFAPSAVIALSAELRLLSASSRKFAATTT